MHCVPYIMTYFFIEKCKISFICCNKNTTYFCEGQSFFVFKIVSKLSMIWSLYCIAKLCVVVYCHFPYGITLRVHWTMVTKWSSVSTLYNSLG